MKPTDRYRTTWGRMGLLLMVVAAGVAVMSADTKVREPGPPGWRLVWSDEFEGDAIDPKKWDYDLGNGFYSYEAEQWISGWGNGELQYYTKEPENACVRDGMLRIVAAKESLHGCGYTSARLRTSRRDRRPLFNARYGRFEIRAKLPLGQGIWPAIWLLPQSDRYGAWAASGEIDIIEARGQEPNKVIGATHYGSCWPANVSSTHPYAFALRGSIAQFHTYALEWEPGRLRWFVDDHCYATQAFWWSSTKREGAKGIAPNSESELNPWPAPFDRPFYLIMNVAVGGRFPGKPDKTTPFPAEMLIDYVRVYEKVGGCGPTPERGDGRLPFRTR